MGSLRTTNRLLLGILLALAADVAIRLDVPAALAETFQLDTCITARPHDKPASYVHVVTHRSEDE